MKTKRIKANLNTRTRWRYIGTPGNYRRVKVTMHRWSLPATEKDYERMVDQVHTAIVDEYMSSKSPPSLADYAVAALRAIGIEKPSK